MRVLCVLIRYLAYMRENRTLPEHSRTAAGHLPCFHLIGIFTQVLLPIVALRTATVYPPTAYYDNTKLPVVANSQNTLENALLTGSTGIISVPSFVEEWALSSEAVRQLLRFWYVVRTHQVFFFMQWG